MWVPSLMHIYYLFFMINETQNMSYNKHHNRSMKVYISTTLFMVFSVTCVIVSLTLF